LKLSNLVKIKSEILEYHPVLHIKYVHFNGILHFSFTVYSALQGIFIPRFFRVND